MKVAPLALFLAIAILPAAGAQTAPVFTASFADVPAGFDPDGSLESNRSYNATVTVQVRMQNVVCQATTIPVTLTVTPKGTASGFTVTGETEKSIPVAQGAYGSGAPAGFSKEVEFALNATTGAIAANASIPIELQATATPPAGCQASSALSPAQTEVATLTANLTPDPPVATESPPGEENGLPGPGLLMGIVAATAAAIVLRRR